MACHSRRKMLGLRGVTFFKQLKYDFFLLLVDTKLMKNNVYNITILQ